jgi:hypothetical protein
MPQPASNPNAQASTLRNLKVLVVLLVFSNIFVGALSVYLLRAVDKRYTNLVNQAVPVLNDLREMMTDTVAAMSSTNPMIFDGSEANRPAEIKAMQEALATERQFRLNLLKNDNLTDEPADREALQKTGDAFGQALTEVAQLYVAGKDAEAARLREEKVRSAFNQRLAAIGKAADAVESMSLGVSKDYTARTNSLSTIVLGVASWPVILLFGLLLLTAVFVIAMMIAFRGKDLSDMP